MKEKKINKYHIRDEDKNTLFERTDTKIGLWANYIVIFFILLSVVILGLVTIEDIKIQYSTEIFITDFIISTVFLIEYIYRWKNSNDKIKFPFRFMHILDLLSFLPFFILIGLYGVGTYSVFILFRIFRIIRIFELIERIPIIAKILSGINKHKIEYLAAIVSITITIVIFSTITYYSEYYGGNAQMFSSLPQTFWWAIVTMTNTGYGDIIPITFIGKIIAILLMFLGPILVTILASITVIIFIESTQIINMGSYKNNKCPKCGKKNEQDSVYCKKCGKKLKKEK